jgi:hypothetical protein
MSSRLTVVAVDPGHAKCGVAVVGPDGDILHHDIVPSAMIGETVDVFAGDYHARTIVVGGGTTSKAVIELISAFRPRTDISTVEEGHSTLEARKLYWEHNPPGCLYSLLPSGLRVPPCPIDDYAAVVIARRYLQGDEDAQ